MLIQSVKHNIPRDSLFQVYDNAHSGMIRFVPALRNAFEPFLMHHSIYGLYQLLFVYLVGYLAYYYSLFAVFFLFYLGARAHLYPAASRLVRLAYARGSDYQTARWEIRPRQDLHEVEYRRVRIIYQHDRRVYRLSEIVRRYVCGHAYGYTARAVHEQVRITAGERGGLHERFVKVRIEVYRVFVYIAQELRRYSAHSGFCITHRGRAVSVHRAEISVSVHEKVSGREILRHAHETVVYSRISVRMIFTQHVADYTRALFMRLIRRQTQLVHRVEYSSVNRFETVAHVRQRSVYYYRHSIGDERFLHLLFQIYRYYL